MVPLPRVSGLNTPAGPNPGLDRAQRLTGLIRNLRVAQTLKVSHLECAALSRRHRAEHATHLLCCTRPIRPREPNRERQKRPRLRYPSAASASAKRQSRDFVQSPRATRPSFRARRQTRLDSARAVKRRPAARFGGHRISQQPERHCIHDRGVAVVDFRHRALVTRFQRCHRCKIGRNRLSFGTRQTRQSFR